MKFILRWNYWMGFLSIFVYLDEVKADKKNHLEIYKKWLGPNYKPDFNSDFSVITCNHLGIYEIQYLMYKYAPGFVSKISLKKTPFIGFIAEKLDTLWIDRADKNSRNEIGIALKYRQESYLNKTVLSPLIVFPEGTTTNGEYILKFKKGAFENLHPIKSIIFKSYFCVGEGIFPTFYQFLLNAIKPFQKYTFYELPVIYPTEYMFENYMKLKPEIMDKVEIYADVVREIWVDISGLKKSDKSFKDYNDYLNLLFDKNEVLS